MTHNIKDIFDKWNRYLIKEETNTGKVNNSLIQSTHKPKQSIFTDTAESNESKRYLIEEEIDTYTDIKTGRVKKKLRPSTQKEKDDIFPGYAQFDKLKRGILEKDKKKMRNCKPGAPYHDAKTGKFTSKAKAGSFSLRTKKRGRDCKAGVAQVKGGKELFTKVDCGRYGKHLCSDPSKLRAPYRKQVEEEISNLLTSNNIEPDTLLKILSELETLFRSDNLDEDKEEKARRIKKLCSRYGLRSFQEWVSVYLKRVNLAVNASKGDLYKDSKNK